MKRKFLRYAMPNALLIVGLAACSGGKPDEVAEAERHLPEQIDFNWHVRPILSDRCFACHGPDGNKRQAGLRLDIESLAKGELSQSPGKRAIAPGRLSHSELWRRITSPDPAQRMPPAESNLRLSPEEIALLGRWIEQGASWKPYWAFIPPERPELPKIEKQRWPVNAIDHFILARLERQGLQPNEWDVPPVPHDQAERERLLRRVTMDLTGLPPAFEEIDTFLTDTSAEAYEKVVDRLLASPHYGEQMALSWLDVARYADSHGYSQDGYRRMWPWRDWVIQAFNENLPFDQFLTWQIAGDLLPNPTQEQVLATAFYRNSRLNSEGGIVPEEYRVEYAAERTNMTGAAFLGLTLECARCHDHKYDPISQKEYYQMFSFFNSVNEAGLVQKDGNSGPQLLLADSESQRKLSVLETGIQQLLRQLQARRDEIRKEFPHGPRLANLDTTSGLIAYFPLDSVKGRTLANQANPKAPGRTSGDPDVIEGKISGALKVTTYDYASLGKIAAFDRADRFSVDLWVNPSQSHEEFSLVSNLAGKNEGYYGYQLYLSYGLPSVRLVHGLPADLIQITAREPLPHRQWTRLTFTYDGSGRAAGLRLYFNGRRVPADINFDQLQRSIRSEVKALRLGGSGEYSFQSGEGWCLLDDVRIYKRHLTELEVAVLFGQRSASDLATGPSATRPSSESLEARLDHFMERSDDASKELTEKLERLRRASFGMLDRLESVMVMEDLPNPRATHILRRGQYDAPTGEVQPGTPAVLPPFDSSWPANRLGLARWLVSEKHPLTARVTVNRFWQQYFGRGIVGTPEDFGSQGELPSHPDLLDWLAREFIDSGWNVKRLQKLIVMSATYRQSSRATSKERRQDPDNRLLARGPSYRLSAEMIRDNALAASGLLVRSIGGPSVKPYQPEGLWTEKNTSSEVLKSYAQDHGDKLYRRSMYTFWRRTSPPPTLSIFGSPTRDFCTLRRGHTNTPLQALVLMNDPQFVEAARVLAKRMMEEGGQSLEQRIAFAYRHLTGCRPEARILKLLTELFAAERAAFEREPARAESLLQVGEYPQEKTLNPIEQASYTVVASAMMNLDETLTKR